MMENKNGKKKAKVIFNSKMCKQLITIVVKINIKHLMNTDLGLVAATFVGNDFYFIFSARS